MNKYIVIGLVIVIFVMVYFYLSKNESDQPKNETPKTRDLPSPQHVAKAFYEAYLSCMKNPAEEAFGNVAMYCQTHTGYTVSDFSQIIEKGGVAQAGADPIICSQSPPDSFSVEKDTENKKSATVNILNTFGERVISFQAVLTNQQDTWLVSNIICPSPKS